MAGLHDADALAWSEQQAELLRRLAHDEVDVLVSKRGTSA